MKKRPSMKDLNHVLQVLEVSRGNIRSLGASSPGEVYAVYRVWLSEVDAAIAALKRY